MTWLINNLWVIAIGLALGTSFFYVINKDMEKAKEWLLRAVIEAEKELGPKTGVLKLRYVYDMFIKAYPLLSKFVSFEEFEDMVDEALEKMKHLLDTNASIATYVGQVEEVK